MNDGLASIVTFLFLASDKLEHKMKKVEKARKKRSKKMSLMFKKNRKKFLNHMGIASVYEAEVLKKQIEELGIMIDSFPK